MRNVAAADYIILADPEGVAVKAFGVDDLLGDGMAAPSTFIIGSDGQVLWAYIAQHDEDRPSASQTLTALYDTLVAVNYTLFEDETLGISFTHPRSWTSIDVGEEEAPWAILQGEDGVSLRITLEFNDQNADLRRVLVNAIDSLALEDGVSSKP